jgi:hypothetical protein
MAVCMYIHIMVDRRRLLVKRPGLILNTWEGCLFLSRKLNPKLQKATYKPQGTSSTNEGK